MNNDEFEQLRREINESVLAEDLEQHHELYADDINVPIEEAWSEPAMGRDYTQHRGNPMTQRLGTGMEKTQPTPHEEAVGASYPTTDPGEVTGFQTPVEGMPRMSLRGDSGYEELQARAEAEGRYPATTPRSLAQPAMRRDMTKGTAEGFPSGHFDPELAAAHGGDPGAYAAGVRRPAPAYGRDHDHMGMAYKADDGSEFPDLNKDGEVTQADILMGRGVIDKPASARDDMGDAHGRDMAYGRDMGMAYKHDDMGDAHGRDMGMAYKGDHSMTWEEMTGEVAHNRVDEANLWESKSATVRGWIIENFNPLRSDGYDPARIVSVLNERTEDELAPIMLQWFHENKRQLQKDGYDFDLVVDKLNED